MTHRFLLIPLLFLLICSCTGSGEARRSLAEAETIMNERPDSALAILESIPSSGLRSDRDRALHALLLTQARSKCYLPIENDSLIASATDFFLDSGDSYHLMLANFYLGDVNYELQNYTKALASLTDSHEMAKELDDPFWIAMSARTLSQIYHDNYCAKEELLFAEIGMENFRRAGNPLFLRYAFINLAIARHCNEDYTSAMSLARQALDSARVHNDGLLEHNATTLLGLSCLATNDYERALNYYRQACRSTETTPDDSAYLAVLYLHNGQPDSAWCIAREISSDLNPVKRHWMEYNLYASADSIHKALEMLKLMNSDNNNAFRKGHRQNLAGTLIDYQNYKSAVNAAKLRTARLKLWSAVSILLLVIIAGIYFGISHHRRNKARISSLIDQAHILREVLEEREAAAISRHDPIHSLLAKSFDEINSICKILNGEESDKMRKRLTTNIRKIIDSYSSDPGKIAEFENYANSHFDNVMLKLRSDFPDLKKEQYLFFLYSRLGFSNSSIALFLKAEKMMAIYNCRKRLKAKFEASASPNRALFFDAIS